MKIQDKICKTKNNYQINNAFYKDFYSCKIFLENFYNL